MPRATGSDRSAHRSLDPARASRFRGQDLDSTVYAGSQLLVRVTSNFDEIRRVLTEVAAGDKHRLTANFNELDAELQEIAEAAGIAVDEESPLLVRVSLEPAESETGPLSPPDAWRVLQDFRARFLDDVRSREAVQLNHVLTSATVTGNPYWHAAGTVNPYWHAAGVANPYWQAPGQAAPYWHGPGSQPPGGVAEYAVPGLGGRSPVTWVGAEPAFGAEELVDGRRRPVIALLDTGVGRHPWLNATIVDRDPRCDRLPIGLPDESSTSDDDVAVNALTGELERASGHGTFIAGLVRQKCPQAKILAIRIVRPDGFVDEVDLLLALNMIWLRQQLAIRRNEPDQLVDVVSLSLGYYHEELGDETFDPLLLAPIRALGRLGVAVVASAGNDASERPMFPAAFAPWRWGPVRRASADEVPVVTVGANNPDGSIALFSNTGPWVSAHRPGAALVSTVPTHDAARTASVEIEATRSRQSRRTIDLDDYSSGFATWSGTSFAAPIMAAELAQTMIERRSLHAEDVGIEAALDRGWAALTARVPAIVRPDPSERRGGDIR